VHNGSPTRIANESRRYESATTGNGGESQNPFGGNGGLFGGGN